MPEQSEWRAPANPKRVNAVLADAAKYGVALDFSSASATGVEEYIRRVEQMGRIAGLFGIRNKVEEARESLFGLGCNFACGGGDARSGTSG